VHSQRAPSGSRLVQPDFINAKKQKFNVEPQDGAYLTALIRKTYATPKAIVDKVTELIK